MKVSALLFVVLLAKSLAVDEGRGSSLPTVGQNETHVNRQDLPCQAEISVTLSIQLNFYHFYFLRSNFPAAEKIKKKCLHI